MNKKIMFAFVSIAILLATSILPVVGSENVSPVISNESKVEVPVRIYTLQGIKEIRKELPINEAIKLQKMAYEAKEAMEILFNKNAYLMERMKANAIIDSFLYELKRNGLLGSMSIKEAKELITGKYLMKYDMEMKKLYAMARLFQQNGWQINTLCFCQMMGTINDLFPWNILIFYLEKMLFETGIPILQRLAFIIHFYFWWIPDAIPHPTTIGYWTLGRYGFYPQPPEIETWGLFGYKKLEGYELRAITLGFTGSVIIVPWASIAIGFCPFIAMKRVE